MVDSADLELWIVKMAMSGFDTVVEVDGDIGDIQGWYDGMAQTRI